MAVPFIGVPFIVLTACPFWHVQDEKSYVVPINWAVPDIVPPEHAEAVKPAVCADAELQSMPFGLHIPYGVVPQVSLGINVSSLAQDET